MISIYKNEIGNIVMVFNNEDQKTLKGTLYNILEELNIVASGDAVTKVDAEKCSLAISDIKTLFGEFLDQKENKVSLGTRMAEKYSEPQIYHADTPGYKELNTLEGDDWEEFLYELATRGITCTYNNQHDCFVIG